MKTTPDKYAHADAHHLFFRSRTTLVAVFLVFMGLGIILVVIDGPVQLSIGTSLIAGALMSLATLWIDQIRNGESIRMKDLVETGLVAAYTRRNLTEEYDALVANAKVIDITGYTLKSFSEQNEEILRKRAEQRTPLPCEFCLLILTPNHLKSCNRLKINPQANIPVRATHCSRRLEIYRALRCDYLRDIFQ